MDYQQFLNLTFVVPCEIGVVHWHTSGVNDNIPSLISEEERQMWTDQCINETKKFHLRVNMTETNHDILAGSIFAFGYYPVGRTCLSLPSARYYISDSTGTVTVIMTIK